MSLFVFLSVSRIFRKVVGGISDSVVIFEDGTRHGDGERSLWPRLGCCLLPRSPRPF